MLVIKIELWPRGDETKAKELGRAFIANDASGGHEVGNYNVRLRRAGDADDWRRGRVEGFPRLTLGSFDLLWRALGSCVGGRGTAVEPKKKRRDKKRNET